MALNEKKLERLNQLLTAFDSGAVQPDEMIKAIDAVIALVKASTETIAKKVADNDGATKARFNELQSDINQALGQLSTFNRKLESEKATIKDVERVAASLRSEIERAISLIPELPDKYDDSEMSERMENQRELIESLQSLIVAENLRNALEALPVGEKLAIEAVEGLREELDKLANDWRKGGSGGGLGSQIVLDIIAQAVADGTIPSGSGVSDGDKGDITVSSGGTVWTLNNDTVGLDELSATGTPDNTKFLRGDNTWAVPPGSSGGITRTVSSISTPTTAGATTVTDYVYFITNTTLTLPTAVSNTNRYTVKCISGTCVVDGDGTETIDGTSTITIQVEDSVDIISDGTNYRIV
jgi:hypothetical protein